jgi:hypothetical protein
LQSPIPLNPDYPSFKIRILVSVFGPNPLAVKKFAIVEDELTVEDDFLTPTLKMKRRNVENRYKDLIDKFYEEK